jgi:hypothetical protein
MPRRPSFSSRSSVVSWKMLIGSIRKYGAEHNERRRTFMRISESKLLWTRWKQKIESSKYKKKAVLMKNGRGDASSAGSSLSI